MRLLRIARGTKFSCCGRLEVPGLDRGPGMSPYQNPPPHLRQVLSSLGDLGQQSPKFLEVNVEPPEP